MGVRAFGALPVAHSRFAILAPAPAVGLNTKPSVPATHHVALPAKPSARFLRPPQVMLAAVFRSANAITTLREGRDHHNGGTAARTSDIELELRPRRIV